MEIIIILRTLLKKWWVIFSAIFICVGIALVLTLHQSSVYSSVVTYVVTPSADILNGPSFVGGLSVLNGQTAITSTYANIVTSSSIMHDTIKTLGLTESQGNSLQVNSRVISGTNIIEITVSGNDPLIVQAYANRIGQSSKKYIRLLHGVFDLWLLEEASSPSRPVMPDLRFNLVVAAALGIVLGGGMVLIYSLKEF